MTSIYGICGFAGSGKDTLANYLIEHHGYVKLSFAGAVKDAVSFIFGWDRAMLEGDTKESRAWREVEDPWWSQRLGFPGFSPRKALQMIGTDVFRNHFHEDIWIAALENKLRKYPKVVITDCRFPNEIAMIRRLGGSILHITRGELPEWFHAVQQGSGEAPTNIHVSETAWIPHTKEAIHIPNDSSLDNLYNTLKQILPPSV
jgi:hypothetical protein